MNGPDHDRPNVSPAGDRLPRPHRTVPSHVAIRHGIVEAPVQLARGSSPKI